MRFVSFVVVVVVVVLVLLYVVVLESFPDERGFGSVNDLVDGAGFGEVLAVGGGFGGEDYLGRVWIGVDSGEIAGGDLEAVEKRGGLSGLHLIGGEGVDDDGESDLDGLSIFERAEMDGRVRRMESVETSMGRKRLWR
jgi:hypothetical protein